MQVVVILFNIVIHLHITQIITVIIQYSLLNFLLFTEKLYVLYFWLILGNIHFIELLTIWTKHNT